MLSKVVTAFADINEFEGIKLARNCPILTHCLFADDALFFLKANSHNCRSFKHIIDWYCAMSGQVVNLDKSCLFFSNNVPGNVKDELCTMLGISGSNNPGKYLGLPVIWGRSKSDALAFVEEKMLKKISGWKQNVLSPASREVLIKAVACAVPMYPMGVFKFPKKVCESFNSALAKFCWGQKCDQGKIHWLSWKKLLKPKCSGGMGFRDFESFNLALLANQSWRILNSPSAFWVQMLKGLYFPNSSFLQVKKGSRASWAWSSILAGREALLKGACWNVGNGESIKIWEDSWVPSFPGFKLLSRPLDVDCSVS